MNSVTKDLNQEVKILIIVGPTSSGKSELAVRLAKLFNGEIISCDSRQVYKGMDLGTGKIEGKWSKTKASAKKYIYKGVPHYLIDFVDPKKQYSVAQFQEQAQKKIAEIAARGRLPVLCGGTGHWIDAVVFEQNLPDVPPNKKLRVKLETKPAEQLFKQLKKLDPVRASSIDRFNKRRLIRALEIVITTGKPVPPPDYKLQTTNYKPLWIGISQPQEILFAKIQKRLKQRLAAGMFNEVKRLRRQGISWKRLMDFGLEYKWCSLYLQKKVNSQEMFRQLLLAIRHYSKRQITWWKRNKNIVWIQKPAETKRLIEKFLK